MSQKWLLVYGLLALFGFADAVYLSVMHFQGADVGCSFITGCDQVLTSDYATLFGVPLAYLGVLYYLTLLFGVTLYYQTEIDKILTGLLLINGSGFLFSLWLIYLQAFVINAFCQFCLISALITSVLIIILVSRLFAKQKEEPGIS